MNIKDNKYGQDENNELHKNTIFTWKFKFWKKITSRSEKFIMSNSKEAQKDTQNSQPIS